MSNKLRTDEIIAIQDIILELILSSGWKDYDNFARTLTERLLNRNSTEKAVLESVVLAFSHPFYSFNAISKKEFLKRFPMIQVIHRLRNFPKEQEIAEVKVSVSLGKSANNESRVSIDDLFPEMNSIDITTGKLLAESSLDIYERVIQNALRDYLRERNATNITERKKDGSLEVADIEDFTLKIKGKLMSFSAVVKGAKSVGKKPNIIFEEIAHQILKANETHPDHILLILAKPIADGVASKIVEYGADCGNRNLVILMDSVNLARFLRSRKMI